ncbi:MAG: PAS domain S-box protein [Desulfarculaceae bacterium]|nr:PAS domain S-box protein [Desulfarculaceae bacterium]MCF8073101.1 PAS domain S-box protein [Desulfarculaceae bacterium]MCF8101814.1 PAS domain S-box protein [Desulfarculaceae bacterium]MCF8115341.1 PAS domain S-box protein [Desulfarculaceae bacterium]
MPPSLAPAVLARNLLIWCLIILGLHLAEGYSYNLFHSLAEMFAVVVAAGIFMVAWNSRRFSQTPYLLFLGIAYLFVGMLDLLHTLAYQGMGVMPGTGPDQATQLWVTARFWEAGALLAAALLGARRIPPWRLLLVFALLTGGAILAIFTGRFPACYVEGAGLTSFKLACEYFICLLLVAAGAAFWWRRGLLDPSVLRLVLWSIACTIAAELCFTMYQDVYGLINQTGHVLKVVSFYLIYRATISASLTRPYEVLFRELGTRTLNLAQSEARVRALLASTASPIILLSPDLRVHQFNQGAEQVFGWQRKDIALKDFLRVLVAPEDQVAMARALRASLAGPVLREQESRLLAKDGRILTFHWNCAPLEDASGEALGVIISGQDISERKLAERERERLISELKTALAEIKTLSGLLPICAHCKKIRDDSGYWRRIETYVEQHSSAEFSHGLCPDCARTLYPTVFKD